MMAGSGFRSSYIVRYIAHHLFHDMASAGHHVCALLRSVGASVLSRLSTCERLPRALTVTQLVRRAADLRLQHFSDQRFSSMPFNAAYVIGIHVARHRHRSTLLKISWYYLTGDDDVDIDCCAVHHSLHLLCRHFSPPLCFSIFAGARRPSSRHVGRRMTYSRRSEYLYLIIERLFHRKHESAKYVCAFCGI